MILPGQYNPNNLNLHDMSYDNNEISDQEQPEEKIFMDDAGLDNLMDLNYPLAAQSYPKITCYKILFNIKRVEKDAAKESEEIEQSKSYQREIS